jgi:hypothetical protein
VLLLGLSVAAACDAGNRRLPLTRHVPLVDSMGVEPAVVSIIPVRERKELRESSGAVMSTVQPGVLFTINDSGNEPLLFALDTTGADRGTWRLAGARNDDWEGAAMGPCARRDTPLDPTTADCIYVGDVGDNAAARRTRTLYRVPEPRATSAGSLDTLRPERLEFRYEDGPHDVEAMYVGSDGTTWLLTKRRLRGRGGAARPSLIFAIDADDWSRPERLAVAVLKDSLPLVPGSAPGRLLTDAARSPDGRYVAVRTYTQVFIFRADSLSGRIRTGEPPSVCHIAGLGERQGEGVTWTRADGRLLLTSEGNDAPLQIVSCPLPRSPAESRAAEPVRPRAR